MGGDSTAGDSADDSAADSPAGDPAAGWRDFFAFDEPYESQADAVETAIEVGEREGDRKSVV